LNLHSNLRGDRTPRTHESISLAHYNWLLQRARHLVAGTSEDPQDLVQELYVNFIQLEESPKFNDPAHEQAYLRKALKNLFTSRRLRQGKDASTRLALVDFDSLASALTAVDRGQLFNVRRDLARIAEYSLIRRTTSRGATAFIMRFFFGYLPSEIIALLKTNRKTFEKMLLRARLEAQAYVERPHVLRFIQRQDKSIPSFPNSLPEETESLFAELQRRMFFEAVGTHEVFDDLGAVYSDSSNLLSLEQTAHVGSCRLCLHQAGQVLDIPDLLLQLFPEPGGPGDSSPGSRGVELERLKKLRRKGREAFEHRPSKLQLIIDGQLRSVQAVTASESRLQLTLKPLSRPEFVEIRSEQGVPMLYFDLQEGAELLEMREAHAEFSEGRTLSASFRFTDGAPVIEVHYHDPLLEHPDDDAFLESDASTASPEDQVSIASQKRVSPSDIVRWIVEILRHFPGGRRGGAAAFTFVLLAVGFLIKMAERPIPSTPFPSGHQLLAASQKKSEAAIPDRGGTLAIYSLDRHSAGNPALTSEKVELIRSKSAKKSVRRLLSSSGTLLDDRWTDENGDLHTSGRVEHEPREKAKVKPSSLWTHVPDVEDFTLLAGAETIAVSSTASGFSLGFHRTTSRPIEGVVEGHMELSGPSLHPVSETLDIQGGTEISTYRFVEVSYCVLSAEQFRRQYQQPSSDTASRPERWDSGESSVPSLVLHALEALDDSPGAEDSIDLERLPRGTIRLSGVLPADIEKRRLIRRLRHLTGGARLALDIHSPEEAPDEHLSLVRSAHPRVTSVEAVQQPVRWIDLLRSPASRGTPLSPVERAALTDAARRMVNDGARFHREVWLNACLSARWFTATELRSLSHEDRILWASLVWRHLSSADSVLQDVTRTLDPQGRSTGPPDFSIDDVAEFASRSERLMQNGERLDRLLSSGFALNVSPQSSTAESSELLPLISATYQLESELIHVAESLR
jgi:DNA-directed RNA polymerase specialized sigma24 family protein